MSALAEAAFDVTGCRDYARIDLCIVGGLTEARKIANWCETHYIKIVPHNPLGPV